MLLWRGGGFFVESMMIWSLPISSRSHRRDFNLWLSSERYIEVRVGWNAVGTRLRHLFPPHKKDPTAPRQWRLAPLFPSLTFIQRTPSCLLIVKPAEQEGYVRGESALTSHSLYLLYNLG